MDPRINPYSPGAGARPPELSGREALIEKANIALDRCRNGLPSRGGIIMVGLRGVGKTVLLNHLAQESEVRGFSVVSIEVPEKRSLPALLIPALRSVLIKLDRAGKINDAVKKALSVLGSFISAMKLKYDDVEFGLEIDSWSGIADSGDLDHDLMELFVTLGETMKVKKTALALFVDEIQYIPEAQFAALIMALHKCTQKQLPILLIGAGLPQLIAQAGRAKSYAERLFEYPEMGPLDKDAAEKALTVPAEKQGILFARGAIAEILSKTQCYPYFLQEWGKHCWECAKKSPITVGSKSKKVSKTITALSRYV